MKNQNIKQSFIGFNNFSNIKVVFLLFIKINIFFIRFSKVEIYKLRYKISLLRVSYSLR